MPTNAPVAGRLRIAFGRTQLAAAAAAAMLALLLLVTPGCSRVRRHLFGGSPGTRTGTVTVSPAAGPVGTTFVLAAAGFRAGEPMTFEVDLPNRTRFVGPSHIAGPDGKVTSKYTPLTGDPAGAYRIKAVGSRGTRATCLLTVQGDTTTTTR